MELHRSTVLQCVLPENQTLCGQNLTDISWQVFILVFKAFSLGKRSLFQESKPVGSFYFKKKKHSLMFQDPFNLLMDLQIHF